MDIPSKLEQVLRGECQGHDHGGDKKTGGALGQDGQSKKGIYGQVDGHTLPARKNQLAGEQKQRQRDQKNEKGIVGSRSRRYREESRSGQHDGSQKAYSRGEQNPSQMKRSENRSKPTQSGGQSGCELVHAQEPEAGDRQPIEQWGFRGAELTVEGGHDVVSALQHFPGTPGVSGFVAVPESGRSQTREEYYEGNSSND